LWIWRPINAGKVTLTEVKTGVATVEDLQKINALLDMQSDVDAAHYEAMKDKK
jgi:uncharacterized ParB-like nuclease family protein